MAAPREPEPISATAGTASTGYNMIRFRNPHRGKRPNQIIKINPQAICPRPIVLLLGVTNRSEPPSDVSEYAQITKAATENPARNLFIASARPKRKNGETITMPVTVKNL